METTLDVRANRIIVHCKGRMDAAGAPRIEGVVLPLFRQMETVGASPVVLDMAGVEYLSSAGIRSLMILSKAAAKVPMGNAVGPSLFRVADAQPQVEKVLEMVGMLEALTGLTQEPEPPAPGEDEDAADYPTLLEQVREAFPAPVSDSMRDAFFTRVVSRGLDKLDGLKTQRPYLGERTEVDYAAARKTTVPNHMAGLDDTVDAMAQYLEGMAIWGHPRTQENVIPPASIPSIVGQFYASVYNPNPVWDEYSHRVAQAEVEASSMCAALVGYDPEEATGVFTFGGTGTTLYGVKLGLEKAQPGAFVNGVQAGDTVVVASDAAHYAKLNALGWLGLGMNALVTVPTDQDNAMGLEELESILRARIEKKQRIACIIATMGTTDAFGMDNLGFIVRLRDRLVEEYKLDYMPHVHADAVIGWAWSVFNDYDFSNNPMRFPARTLRSLWDAQLGIRDLHLADSVGIDFHKTGYAPYVSSLFLVKTQKDFDLTSREKGSMAYIFQWGNYHPGVFTLETSRGGGAVLSALANLKFFGKDGMRALLGHIVTMAESLRFRLERSGFTCPVNDYNYGPVTLFRVYPKDVDPKTARKAEFEDPGSAEQLRANNAFNRRVFEILHKEVHEGEGVALSVTDRYRRAVNGEPIVALKSFVMSPFTEKKTMDRLMECLKRAWEQANSAGA